MRKPVYIALCWLFVGCTVHASGAPAVGGARAASKIRNWKELQEDRIVMQSSDYSCGAAAVATLLTHYFADPVAETAIMKDILKTLSASDKKNREEEGFSLLDLNDYLVARGYESTGFRLTLAELQQMPLPALVHLSVDGDKHFVVLAKIRGDQIYLADPSRGNLRLSVGTFASEWTNIILVVSKPGVVQPPPPAASDEDVIRDRMLSAYRATVRERP